MSPVCYLISSGNNCVKHGMEWNGMEWIGMKGNGMEHVIFSLCNKYMSTEY